LPGGLFLFSPYPRSTRKLIPRFTVVRVLVDPIEQLFAAWLLAPGRLSFRFADHWVRGRFAVKNSDRQIEWRWGALVPFIWLGNAHCMSQRRNSFNAKDDLCEIMLVMKGEAGASRRRRHATSTPAAKGS
jgi:hypothetical protein